MVEPSCRTVMNPFIGNFDRHYNVQGFLMTHGRTSDRGTDDLAFCLETPQTRMGMHSVICTCWCHLWPTVCCSVFCPAVELVDSLKEYESSSLAQLAASTSSLKLLSGRAFDFIIHVPYLYKGPVYPGLLVFFRQHTWLTWLCVLALLVGMHSI